MNGFMNTNTVPAPENIDLLYQCISDGRIGAAMQMVPALEKSTRADVLFNIALAYYMADDPTKSIEFIDRALASVKKMAPVTRGMVTGGFNTARRLDIDAKSFLKPMTEQFVTSMPNIATEDILMMGAYVANIANLAAKRSVYLSELHGANFDEFKKEMM